MNEPFCHGCWPVNPKVERTIELEFFQGGPSLLLECTQLPGKASRQTRIVQQWCDFFTSSDELRELYVSTRLPPRLFEAICHQTNLRQFGFKWGPIKDLAPIARLAKLTHLGIGSSSVTDLSPLAELKSLTMLSISNADRLSDYSPLGKLRDLQYLHIEGDLWSSNKRAPIDDLDFLSKLGNLRGLSLDYVKIDASDWHKPIMKLDKLEELFVPEMRLDARDALLASLSELKLHNLS
jgi:Leucine-rich repeat (LRR) protein